MHVRFVAGRCWLPLLAFALCIVPAAVRGEDSESSAKASNNTIRVLLTYGGHGDPPKSLGKILDDAPNVACTQMTLPESAGLLKPGLGKDYDVIVMYDMVRGISQSQQAAFANLLKDGGIGVVSLHHNLCAHRDWEEFVDIVGGKYVFSKTWNYTNDDKPFGVSSVKFGDISVTVADRTHPITKGVDDFQVHDEMYIHCFTAPDVNVLLTSNSLGGGPAIAWTHKYGKTPVFFFMLGHGDNAWRAPAFKTLLLNGIHWAAGR